MSFEQMLRQIFGNLGDGVETALEVADDVRRKLFFVFLLGILHFMVLFGGHVVAQTIAPGWFSVFNSLWGTFWVCSLMLGAIMFGGLPLHAVFIANAAGNKEGHEATRVLIGFCVVETMVNVLFALVPIANDPLSWAALLTLPSSVGGYFLYRYMGGLVINWARWAVVPLFNIVLAVATIIVQYLKVTYADTIASVTSSASGFSFAFLSDLGFWVMVLIVGGLLWSLKGGSNHGASH